MKIFSKMANAKLVERINEISDNTLGWTSLLFPFSKLLDEHRTDYHIKIALNLINDIMREKEVEIFVCHDLTTFILMHNIEKPVYDKLIFQLRYLFMDDPLAYLEEGEENKDFCKKYDIDSDWDKFYNLVKNKMLEQKRGISSKTTSKNNKITKKKQNKSKKNQTIIDHVKNLSAKTHFFNASNLANIENDLTNADLSNVMRRQPICAAVPSMMVRKVFDELYINIAHLRKVLGQDVDLLSNRWLFKYLTEILDERMLFMIRNNTKRYLESPISINLNVQTLMSDAFAEFDTALKPEMKISIIIEIQVSDVFADMQAFIIARKMVHDLGYRICLDGLNSLSFQQVRRDRLGFDLIKLQWNADIPSDINTLENKRILNAINACGVNRVILTRCDNKKAIDYGQELGISLFQGRYLDKLMNPMSKIEN